MFLVILSNIFPGNFRFALPTVFTAVEEIKKQFSDNYVKTTGGLIICTENPVGVTIA